jgi:16S rRNA processing protein RimM
MAVAEPEHLVVGHLSKAHGTRGELLVWLLTDRPEVVFAPGQRLLLGTDTGQVAEPAAELEIEASRPFKRGLLVRLVGVEDRNAAERLANRYLLAPRAELDEGAEEGVYYHQLLGLLVQTTDGAVVGRVREVYETEPRHLLEVKGQGRVHLIPFSPEVVRSVDLEGGRLVIDPPVGLLEL